MANPVRRVAVIMAGGSGERFWPLSRSHRPKQLLRLTSDTETLLEEAVSRIAPLVGGEQVYIATAAHLRGAITEAQLPLPAENILAEPAKRNTAGCLCWVAAELSARSPDEEVSIAILTADHLIGTPDAFRAKVAEALSAAEQFDALVTIGVPPTRPETGYGYVEIVPFADPEERVHRVARFREKPNLDLAEEFAASGRHFWNSGMFFWKLQTFLKEMAHASPAHGTATLEMTKALAAQDATAAARAFERLPDISIDYALMEKARNVLMIEADFPWDDVGAWDAMDRSRTRDDQGNVVEGNPVLIETRNSVVINEAGAEHIAVGVVGMDNVVVIVSKDSVLVVPKDRAQEVRHVPRELKKRGAKQV